MAKARARSTPQAPVEVFGEFKYAAESWSRERRIVVKAEVVHQEGREPRDNPRFVAVKLSSMKPEQAYDVYRGRGDIENRIKSRNSITVCRSTGRARRASSRNSFEC